MTKEELRAKGAEIRSSLTDKRAGQYSREIQHRLFLCSAFKKASRIFVFVSIRDEVRTIDWLDALWKTGKTICAPKVEGKEMYFAPISSFDDLSEGCFHVLEPKADRSHAVVPDDNDLILVPGLLFDADGYRIGYGGGYYDRFFAKQNRGIRLGIFYDAQKSEGLPVSAYDEKMSAVLTEKGFYIFDKSLEDTMGVSYIDDIPNTEPERQYYFIDKCKDIVWEKSCRLGRPLTCNLRVQGCQMNFKDGEKLLGILKEIGYVETENESADFVLFNTCTIRENANLKVYGQLGYLSNVKKKHPDMMIALCGCMMQEEHVVEKIKKSYRFVDLIFGTHNIYKLAELLYAAFHSRKMVVDIMKDADRIVEDLPSERKYPFKSGVNVMYGCNNFCSYCIVPYVRGRERSRRPEDILAEVRSLATQGVVEIMLLGQNVNSYGKNLEEPVTFAQLLRQVEAIDGIKRIRFMTSHPKDLSDELIEVMAESKKICRQFHLPLQSGSSRILGLMNRRYTKEQYLRLVDKLKAAMPDISISTDIIVGFPGETEEDFLETLDVVNKVRFDSAYTFIYSMRTGTPAASMEQVSEEEVKCRFNRLLETISAISREKTERNVGKVCEALLEEVNEKDSSLVTGRLEDNSVVHLKGHFDLIGTIQKVRLTEAKGFYYYGELLMNEDTGL